MQRIRRSLGQLKTETRTFQNQKLEDELVKCLKHPDGKSWLDRTLRRVGKLVVMTTEELRMEKLSARRRGRRQLKEASGANKVSV